MDIAFEDKELRKQANDYKKSKKEMGSLRAELYHTRLNDLRDAQSLEDLRFLPGNYHELTNNRKGQWACSLDNPYRLIFKPQEDPIPMNADGQYIWSEIKAVTIIGIVNYHKEK